jgi:hypothetical protein
VVESRRKRQDRSIDHFCDVMIKMIRTVDLSQTIERHNHYHPPHYHHKQCLMMHVTLYCRVSGALASPGSEGTHS